ncbi:MFS transporter [Azoarcus olearius]|uniref:Symporter protein n=1 Tax=Azoarcus sp. (strain BH72) TaxID=418699 RepID=A1KAS3_AZOSB|nr:MFS transporter [Azoarcus olearius]CAL95929.1 putative symporter protein [Azoarcus olearius]
MAAEPATTLPAEALPAATRRRARVLAYGALGLPLAFAALPIYVHVPRLYADQLGLPLAAVGAVLLLTRIIDAASDPLIGRACDRFRRRAVIVLALPLLAASLPALLAPPPDAGLGWLATMLVLVSLGYSLASIAYHAWGAELGQDAHERTVAVASREACALVGVMLAAALPTVLDRDAAVALGRLGMLFLPLLAAAALLTLLFGPAERAGHHSPAAGIAARPATLADPVLVRLLAVVAANAIAAAVPSATVLFFVADVLGADRQAGLFLLLYFAAAAAGLPLWVALARRLGKLRAWALAMAGAVLVFAWAAALGPGDAAAFAAVCVLSGLAFGADLALPAALLGDLLARDGRSGAGACFGWWNFVAKASLALAAGIALPLLGWLGYSPGAQDEAARDALRAVYALLPVALKCVALALLWRWRGWLDPCPAPEPRSPEET